MRKLGPRRWRGPFFRRLDRRVLHLQTPTFAQVLSAPTDVTLETRAPAFDGKSRLC